MISTENGRFFRLYDGKLSILLDRYGAGIVSISFAKIADSFQNLALSVYKSCDSSPDPTFAGRTLGPIAGRVSKGLLELDGEAFSLTLNEGSNHLHGGNENLSSVLWNVSKEITSEVDSNEITFTCDLPDGLEGYPGNRSFEVTYSIKKEHTLRIEYKVVSDKTTYVSLSNHTYFNLSGDFTRPVSNSLLKIDAGKVLYNNAKHIPFELNEVEGAMDFTEERKLDFTDKNKIISLHPQLRNALGYNNGYILDINRDYEKSVLFFKSLESGIALEIATDQPCIVFYSGGYFDSSLRLFDGSFGNYSCALAFEAQDWPDALNFNGAPKNILHSSETYHRFIEYRFS